MYSDYSELRDKKGMSDYAVAKAVPIGRSILSDWKTGKHVPNNRNLQKIADYFDVTVDYLLKGEKLTPEAQDQIGKVFCKAPIGKMHDTFMEEFQKDPVFMEHIRILWSLDKDNKTAVYKIIKGLYYSSKEEKEKEVALNA